MNLIDTTLLTAEARAELNFKIRMKTAQIARCFAVFLSISMVAYATSANSQRCGATCANPQSLLGLSEQYLVASIPELQRAQKPERGPRSSMGKWRLTDAYFAAQPYVATYFIRNRLVSRIEYLSLASKAQCMKRLPFDMAKAELRKEFGDSPVGGSFAENGRTTQTLTFSNNGIDASLHLSTSPDACSTRLIYRLAQVKDGSAL